MIGWSTVSKAADMSRSTTAALVYLLHNVYTMFEQGNDYVRCIIVDYSKAFDVINHPILLRELGVLGLSVPIYSWIADFLTGRTQAVKCNSFTSKFKPTSRSIVQGSVLGPTLYVALARKLKTLSTKNKIPKYADDVSLLTPQHTDSSAEDEFRHIVDWSSENKLVINVKKTKEIIFWRSSKCANKYVIPEIPGIERVDQAKLLGVILTSTLSWSAHVDFLLSTATQRFYLLNQLKHMSFCISGLDTVFRALVLSRVTYALPAFSGNIAQSDIDRINAMLRKARRWRLTNSDIDFQFLSTLSDNALFSKIQSPTHCLYQLLPATALNNHYNLRPASLSHYSIPLIRDDKLFKSFIYRNSRQQ